MNARERFLETMLFGQPDRPPLHPGGGRRSTLAVWHAQGLPQEHHNDYQEYAYRLAGGKLPWPESPPLFAPTERMIPHFEEKVLEERERTRVVQDWKGNVCEISNEYGLEYLREAIDFVTRKWIKCPVETRDDWEDMKRRYEPDDPERLSADRVAPAEELAQRQAPIKLQFSGPFWQLREWVGFEQLCTLFYDDPDWAREMIAFWEEYMLRLMERIFAHAVPDEMHVSEDMAYKNFSMISPDMARTFLLPTWKRWGEMVHNAGVPVYSMDSDGYVGELIPLWIEAGFQCCDPMEVAAGNDIVAFRKQFKHDIAFRGGVDKRAMARGGKAIEAEIERIRPVIEDGGYQPGCDHGVPADVSWPDYVYYTELLARATGWL